MFIPGFLISWATFPGVIIHEFAHKKACEWRGVYVHNVEFFKLSGGGQVTHEIPDRFDDTFAISAAPFVVNTALAFILYLAALVAVYAPASLGALSAETTEPVALIAGWLAISIGWHAIPSRVDANNIWRDAKRNWRSSALAAVALPIAALFYLADLLAFFWFDAIYSLAIGAAAYGCLVLLNLI